MEKKILVIDDELSIGELIKDFLDGSGYTTFIATNAMQGIEIVRAERPALVLVDILMPEISGLECLKRIKQLYPETIVIIVTGLQDEQVAKQAIRQGAYDYILKPFNLDYLEKSILSRIFPS